MAPPPAGERAAVAAGPRDAAAHARAMAGWPCLSTIERREPATPPPPPAAFTLAAWNLERCRHVEDAAAAIAAAGADVVLLSEMDLGMARSGQRHTTADLAALLGMGHVYGVEFVELGLGDARETAACAGEANRAGLHGNAILSRWPLRAPALLPLDDGGGWFTAAPRGDGQMRVGGRMAIAAEIETARGRFGLVSVHYESQSSPESRTAQTDRLLAAVATRFGDGPCAIGGDLNTAAFADLAPDVVLADPGAREPSFTRFAAAGFGWAGANTGAPTTRLHPWEAPRPGRVLDWLLLRGAAVSGPFVAPALSPAGLVLSDHEMVGARVAPLPPPPPAFPPGADPA